MILSRFFITILFLSICSFLSAQEYKAEIKTEFSEYINYLMEMDFEKSMDYILPEFFEIIPKSQMISLMEQTFNNPTVEIELKNAQIKEINDVQEIEQNYYALLVYSNQMNMKFKSEKEESEEEKRNRIKLTKLSFEQTFGSKNVIYNEQTEFFEVMVEKQVYAISKNGLSDWKFLVVEKKQKAILEKLLPKELVEKI